MTFFHPFKGRVTVAELEEKEALLILTTFPGLGRVRIHKLLSLMGSARAVLSADPEAINAILGGLKKVSEKWLTWPQDEGWKKDLAKVVQENVSLISFRDEAYPKQLLNVPDCPPLLYVKGNVLPQGSKSIAIVGTRQSSVYGTEMAALFARELAAYGYIIVSGLARGIDTAAHIGALECGRTMAVIGSGLADIYPRENQTLAHKIREAGALISELPMMTPPDRQNFPQRNLIVAGMVDAILLIEAPKASGAMITMNMGALQHKPLFALPGRVDMNFGGNHALIKRQEARLVETPQDLLEGLKADIGGNPSLVEPCGIALDLDERLLLSNLPKHEISIDSIASLSKLPAPKLNALLMSLLLKGAIKEFPGRIYKKIRE